MHEKAQQTSLPRGYFPIRITLGTGLANRFINEAKQNHSISILQTPQPTDQQYEEAVIAVPFPDKEMLRIAFNIFASKMEREHGVNTKFLMESATEFM